jgi:hypothetical protein
MISFSRFHLSLGVTLQLVPHHIPSTSSTITLALLCTSNRCDKLFVASLLSSSRGQYRSLSSFPSCSVVGPPVHPPFTIKSSQNTGICTGDLPPHTLRSKLIRLSESRLGDSATDHLTLNMTKPTCKYGAACYRVSCLLH